MNFKNLESDEKIIIKNRKENLFKFQPKLIDLSRTTSNLSFNQLWDLVRRDGQDFVANYEARHKDAKKLDIKNSEVYWKRDKQKHQLTIKDRLAIIKSIIIEKHNIKKIASDFSISTSLVYSVLKSYKKNEVNKLLAKTKERTLENN